MTEATVRNKNILSALMTAILATCMAFSIIMAGKITILILLVVVVVILILTILKPYWGLCFLVSLIPFEGLLISSPILSFMKGYGILLAIVSLPIILLYRINYISLSKIPPIYLLFVLWSFSSLIWASDVSLNLIKNFTYLSLFILYLLIILLPEKKDNLLHVKGFVFGAFLSVFTIPILGLDINTAYTRIAGGGLNANDYAATIAIAMPLALMWFQVEKTWMRTIPIIFIPVGLLAIAFTKSRGGSIALFPFVIYSLILLKHKGLRKFIVIALLGVSICTLIYFAPAGYFERVSALGIETSGRFNLRLDIWIAGLNMFFNNPILGVGTGNFPVLLRKYAETSIGGGVAVAHNAFLSVAGELGIVGILIFMLLIVTHLKKILVAIFQDDDQKTKIIATGLFFAFSAYLIAAMSLTWEYRKVLPLLIGSIILLERKNKYEI